MGPYRAIPVEPVERHRTLDPWLLALLFAWVCDVGRIGLGLLDGRSVLGEVAFAVLLAATTVIVGLASLKKRRRTSRRDA